MSEREQFEAAFFANPSGGGLNEFCWRIWQAARAQSAQPAQAEAVPVAVVKYQVGGLAVHIVGDVQEGDELFKTPQQADEVRWGIDWGTHGDRTCVSIIKKHTDGKMEVVATEYEPERKAAPKQAETEMRPADKHDMAVYRAIADGYFADKQVLTQNLQAEHDLKDTRCGYCGYMTYQREHMNCIRAASKQSHVPEADCGNIDWKAQYEHQKRRAEMWIAKYEADIGPLEKAGPVAQQPHECARSHPHENMDGFCVLRTEIARLTNENARLKAQQPQADQSLRQDALQSLAYANGAKAGWNLAVAADEAGFANIMDQVPEAVRTLKQTRAQQPQAEAVPNVCASFFTESAELIGTTEAPIRRVDREDDGTLHVYIDHWPQQAEAVPSGVARDAEAYHWLTTAITSPEPWVVLQKAFGHMTQERPPTKAEVDAAIYAAIAQQKGDV